MELAPCLSREILCGINLGKTTGKRHVCAFKGRGDAPGKRNYSLRRRPPKLGGGSA